MKPNFALSLSFEGIRLLHRAAGGWRIVGEVGLDTDDLPGELAVLRRTATALDPGGLRTKLLLPEGQIKYLTLDTPDMDDAARTDAARAALDGATPYAVDDLAFDISVEGNKTHVAAVAKETLAEAEAFASEHRFNPISFAAVPDAAGYLGEPFFGPARAANALLEPGEEVEPDGIAVVVVGDVAAQDGPVVDAAEEDVAAQVDTPAPEAEEEPDTADLPGAAADIDAPVVEETLEEQQEEEAPALFKSRLTKPDPIDAAEAPEPDESGPEPAPAPVPSATDIDDVPPMPVLPALGAATRDASAPTKPAPAVPAQPGFASRRAADKPPARREPVVSSPAPAPAPPVPAPELPVAADSFAPEEPEPATARIAPAMSAARTTAVAAASAAAAPIGRFLSRRRAPVQGVPQPVAVAAAPNSEAERMTVFGARRGDVGGKPRFLGLMLTAALLIFLAGVAAWASVFLDDGLKLSRLFGEREPARTASAPQTSETSDGVQTAALDAGLTEEDSAVLDALREPVAPQIEELTPQELEAKYAATGIWPKAPVVPPEPAGVVSINDLYVTSIDPVSTANDAVALPAAASFATDVVIGAVAAPAAAGTQFVLNDQGLVVATAAGALSPDGYTVFLGSPPVVPPATPTRFQAVPQDDGVRSALAAFRPRERPQDLSEQNERANLDGLTRGELADFRPRLRPQSVQEQAEEAAASQAPEAPDTDEAVQAALAAPEPSPFENATRFATQASLRPDTRPRNFSRIVRRAQRAEQQGASEETRVASAATVAPRTVQPKIPSKTTVAKQATVRNAINLRKVNLIGVYGKPSSRRALVRLGNGRYKKVVVGDRVDGGRVTAIGDSELRYRKSGRDIVLKMPRS